MENYMQEVAGKNRDLNRAQNLLSARTKELNQKEAELQTKQEQLQQQQETFQLQRSELIAKQKELEAQEAATRAKLQAKERELEAIRSSVTKALLGFADKGLNVETKDGKVYVSMEDKLLFASGSWTVSPQGIGALKTLARILEDNPDLTIMVEGHTDNVPIKTAVYQDNWDLSVIRATSVVRILTETYGVAPLQIQPCGRGEFKPVATNETTDGRAKNRRTEIIMAPRLDKLFEMLQNN
jgi:chemotaxis protein MotB